MDTRFWGPDGWKLLHSITENYPDKPNKKDKDLYRKFFTSLPYVLPCVYCRKSLREYMKELGLRRNLESRNKLCLWLYRIHNKVNRKLKNQGLNKKPNPSYADVRAHYKKYLQTIINNNCSDSPGWDFLYSIVFNYPVHKSELSQIRFEQHIHFFSTFSQIIPFTGIRLLFKDYMKNEDLEKKLEKRSSLKRWIHSIETKVKRSINQSCLNYKIRCINVEKYRAGCHKTTCRKKGIIVK